MESVPVQYFKHMHLSPRKKKKKSMKVPEDSYCDELLTCEPDCIAFTQFELSAVTKHLFLYINKKISTIKVACKNHQNAGK